MRPLPAFTLHRPSTLAETMRLLGELEGDVRILAGGTDLVVNLRHGLESPRHVVSLARVRELCERKVSADGVRIGALVSIAEIASDVALAELAPVLSQAASQVSAPTLRAQGTLGGNLALDTRCLWINQSEGWRRAAGYCLKRDGTLCHVAPGSPLCVAAYSGDLAPALLALDAEVRIHGARGDRLEPLERIYSGDGTHPLTLERRELIAEVMVPHEALGRSGRYAKLRVREAIDFPLAGVAVSARIDAGVAREVRIALTAVAPRPMRAREAEDCLEGRALDEDAIACAVDRVRRAAEPLKTTVQYSPWYRRHRLGLFLRDSLRALRAGEV